MSTTEHAGSEPILTPENLLRAHACVLCQRRKVKCDRRDPCAACTKTRADCEFRAPAPPRRRPRKSPEAMLLTRLRRYEDLLRGFGVKIESMSSDADVVARRVQAMEIISDGKTTLNRDPAFEMSGKQAQGQMIVRNGKARYLENKLWTHLSDEFMEASDMLPVSSEDEDYEEQSHPHEYTMDPHGGDLLLGSSPRSLELRSQHPEPIQGFRLWQAYLDNFNPLTKVLHAPTVQQALLEATGNLDDVSKSMEALMFAIYSCAVYSMSNSECENVTGGTKPFVLTKYQCATRQALVSAGLLRTSNMVVLQAYTLFLLSMRLRYDSHSLWTLTGVALRIAQRMGLHRDGVDLKLPPFETEMRRRLWWLILLLEARASEFSAVGQSMRYTDWTTRTPLNVNDSSLHPSMVELPAEQNGATEMIHCLIRYEVGNFLKSGGAQSTIDGSWQKFQSSEVSVKDKEKAIQTLEELFERKFLRYCDPSIPLHFISALVAGSTASKLRFRAYHPRHHWARAESVLAEEKDMLFSACVKIMENDNIAQSSPSTQRYLWHVNAQFQFDALIHVLGELRSRPASDQTNRAWQQVDEVFQHHSNMLTDTKKGLHVAITRLAVRAWENYERYPSTGPHPLYQIQSPLFREALSRNATSKISQPEGATEMPNAAEQDQLAPAPTESMVDALGPPFDFNGLLMESTPMDWSRWDDLMQDFELNPTGSTF